MAAGPAAAHPTGAAPGAPPLEVAEAALAELAGLAPSPVLAGRLRRAARRLAACELSRPDADDPVWADLLDAVTVQETRLFRHPGQFAALALPDLRDAALREGRPLRMLSAGCATGEEAFSLAALALAEDATPAEVLGLDLCRPAIEAARSGRVAAGLGDPLALVPPACRFWFAGGLVAPEVRRLCRFGRANLLQPAVPDLSYDLILCRNVLIYLTPAGRARVLGHLIAALVPGGVLGLGPSDDAPAGLEALGEALWRKPR
jgi:chemotaxis protein methyltransferase CheR